MVRESGSDGFKFSCKFWGGFLVFVFKSEFSVSNSKNFDAIFAGLLNVYLNPIECSLLCSLGARF